MNLLKNYKILLVLTMTRLSKFLALMRAERFWLRYPAQENIRSELVDVGGTQRRSMAISGSLVLNSFPKSLKYQ